jgi:hypothetical protein
MADSPARTNSLRQLASDWGARDPAQAASWLDRLPAGAGREAAVQTFADAVKRTDPGSLHFTIANAVTVYLSAMRQGRRARETHRAETLKVTYPLWRPSDARDAFEKKRRRRKVVSGPNGRE